MACHLTCFRPQCKERVRHGVTAGARNGEQTGVLAELRGRLLRAIPPDGTML
jgi:hypothetical protein